MDELDLSVLLVDWLREHYPSVKIDIEDRMHYVGGRTLIRASSVNNSVIIGGTIDELFIPWRNGSKDDPTLLNAANPHFFGYFKYWFEESYGWLIRDI